MGHAQAVADGGVSGDALYDDRPAPVIASEQELLHTTVLVAELNFQMQDALANAVEPEMPRLNDTGVHRSHSNLVNLVSFDLIVIVPAGDVFIVVVAKSIGFASQVGMGSVPSSSRDAPLASDHTVIWRFHVQTDETARNGQPWR